MKSKRTVFSFLLVLSLLINVLGGVVPALAAGIPVIDDFEAGLPTGTDANGVAIGFVTLPRSEQQRCDLNHGCTSCSCAGRGRSQQCSEDGFERCLLCGLRPQL